MRDKKKKKIKHLAPKSLLSEAMNLEVGKQLGLNSLKSIF